MRRGDKPVPIIKSESYQPSAALWLSYYNLQIIEKSFIYPTIFLGLFGGGDALRCSAVTHRRIGNKPDNIHFWQASM